MFQAAAGAEVSHGPVGMTFLHGAVGHGGPKLGAETMDSFGSRQQNSPAFNFNQTRYTILPNAALVA